MGWYGLDWSSSGKGQIVGSCECEPLGSIKCWETVGWLHKWWPFE
jgi:hypothetical protein